MFRNVALDLHFLILLCVRYRVSLSDFNEVKRILKSFFRVQTSFRRRTDYRSINDVAL